jgi:hypothetical protein
VPYFRLLLQALLNRQELDELGRRGQSLGG